MASLVNDPNGLRRILFVAPDGSRKTVRLGRVDRKTAQSICRHVEALLSARIAAQPIPRDTATWLAGVGEPLYGRLARVGLVAPKDSATGATVKTFLASYLADRTDLRPGTRIILEQAARHVVTVLGADTPLASVTPTEADRFKAWLVSRGLSRSTVAKWVRYAKHFFAVAYRRKLIAENPFAYVSGGQVIGDPARRQFIPADDVRRVLEAIPDPEWRALVVLARWGGLRIPSEALALQWGDVHWDRGVFVVRSPKTAYREGGIRTVPLFPEVRAALDHLWELAAEGATAVFTRFRGSEQNLRTQLSRWCERSGVRPWPKPFQNMRASRATELADQFPSHVCAAWLGHTERIAEAFYRQVTDEHLARALTLPSALGLSSKAAHNPAQY